MKNTASFENTGMTNETKWEVDRAHSQISFKVRHLKIAHIKGYFKTFDANIYTVAQNFLTAMIDLWIDPSSIYTGEAKRDAHLKGPDFFDVLNHKQMTFTATGIGEPDEHGDQELSGELTIKGIVKQVKLIVRFGGSVIDPWGNEKVGFTVTGRLKRSDWGLEWNTPLEEGGFMLSDEVIIECELELINVTGKAIALEAESMDGLNIYI